MSKGEVTAVNVRGASTLTLLRTRARNIRSVYERLCGCHVDGVKVPLLYDSKEGNGDDDAKINGLRGYIAQHVRVAKDLRGKVERSSRSKSSWKKYNKGAAVVQELSRREQEEADGARAFAASTGPERSAPVVLYPKKSDVGWRRYENVE